MKKVLTIAGSDCSGGAGIQADLKTFAVHKVYGMSVITSLTAQNTLGVTDVLDVPAEFVERQLDAVFSDIRPDAIKIGMVANEEIIKSIAKKLIEYNAKNIVLDPVMISTSGSKLMDSSAHKALIEHLFPLAGIVTPNMAEASALCELQVTLKDDMEKASEMIGALTKGAVLVKGGHLHDCSDDLLYIDNSISWIEGIRVENLNTHGTGCTLSSAIACNLAIGMNIKPAVLEAKRYLTGAIRDNLDLGSGHGPLNHLYNIEHR